MKNLTKKQWRVIILSLILLGLIPGALAICAAQDDGVYTYEFHLYFDQGRLVADRDFSYPLDLIAQAYHQPGDGDYHGEIRSVQNKLLAVFNFSLHQGKNAVYAPYFDNAKRGLFYNSQEKLLLRLDLAPGGPVCNEDNFCNQKVGEDSQNCPSDCPSSSVSTSPTYPPRKLNLKELLLSKRLWSGMGIVLVLIIVFKMWGKRNSRNKLPPPQIQNVPQA